MILIVDEDLINELIETMSKRLEEITVSKMAAKEELNSIITAMKQFTRAPVFIIPCMTKEVFGDRSDLWLSEHTMGVQSVAAAIQNMLLVAHDAGLGGCWCSSPLICPTAIRQVLNIPQSVEPQAIIALGYSDETPEPPARKKFSDIVFLNKWNNRYKPSTYKP
jgi:nitroreductase